MQTVLLLLLHLYLLLPLHLLHLRLALRLSLPLHLLASHRLRTFPLSLGAHLSLLLRPLRRSRLNSRRLSLSRLLLLLHLRLVLRAHLRRDARPGVPPPALQHLGEGNERHRRRRIRGPQGQIQRKVPGIVPLEQLGALKRTLARATRVVVEPRRVGDRASRRRLVVLLCLVLLCLVL